MTAHEAVVHLLNMMKTTATKHLTTQGAVRDTYWDITERLWTGIHSLLYIGAEPRAVVEGIAEEFMVLAPFQDDAESQRLYTIYAALLTGAVQPVIA